MAQFSYEDLKNKNTTKTRKVGYFSLKDDGDEAIVSFNYDDPSEFDLLTVHNIQIDGRWRRVSCLRTGHDPLEKCPLCESGEKVYSKFYVKLIQYVKNDQGQLEVQAKVWERPARFADELRGFILEYGGLKNQIFKIKRHGAKGSVDTNYQLMLASPAIYKPELGYIPNFEAFKDFDLSHHSYMNKSAEEMKVFLSSGSFPMNNKVLQQNENSVENKPTTETPMWERQPETAVRRPANTAYAETFNNNPTSNEKNESNLDPTISRPRRVYDSNYNK